MSEQQKSWAHKSLFGTFLDELIGSGAKRVMETAKQVAPKCGFCGLPTVVRCMSCGRFVCRTHGFVNAQSLEKFNVICSECISEFFPFVTVEPPRHHPGQQQDDPWNHSQKPWEILGIDWHAPDEEIEAARKKRAREVHPDRATDEHDRVKREEVMKLVNAAAEWMLKRRRGTK
jgi:hypothetical protein